MHTFTRNALSLVRFTDHTLLKSAVLILGLCLCTLASYAQAPNLINFQAQLADGGTLPSTITATFSIFDRSTGGSALWTEEQTIMQTNGAFNVLLGSVMSFPATLFSSSGERYLQVEVNGQQTGARFQLSSVAYALRAEAADRTGPTGIRFPDGSLQTTAATGSGGSSPWSASGSNVFYNAGNIGIGTSNPEGRLDIDDAFKFQTHNIGNGNQSMRLFFDENDAGGSSSGKWGFSFIHAGDNDDTHIFNGTTFSLPRNHFYILNHEDNSQGEVALSISRVNGNVGIGTTSPANAFLDIEPSANATARPLVYAGTPAANDWRSQNVAEFRSGPSASYTGTVLTASARRGDDANYNLLKLSNNLRNTESTKFLVRGDGNVGIGTTNPQTPLHVIGR